MITNHGMKFTLFVRVKIVYLIAMGNTFAIGNLSTFCHSKNPAPIHLHVLIACGMGLLPQSTLSTFRSFGGESTLKIYTSKTQSWFCIGFLLWQNVYNYSNCSPCCCLISVILSTREIPIRTWQIYWLIEINADSSAAQWVLSQPMCMYVIHMDQSLFHYSTLYMIIIA